MSLCLRFTPPNPSIRDQPVSLCVRAHCSSGYCHSFATLLDLITQHTFAVCWNPSHARLHGYNLQPMLVCGRAYTIATRLCCPCSHVLTRTCHSLRKCTCMYTRSTFSESLASRCGFSANNMWGLSLICLRSVCVGARGYVSNIVVRNQAPPSIG
jgi:hypothetical protein